MKQSMSTKSLFPKFLSGRLSSNSLNDKSSIGSSSYRRRRNSFASFFQNSPAHRSREEGYSDKFLPGLRLNTSTPKLKSNEDFRYQELNNSKQLANYYNFKEVKHFIIFWEKKFKEH